ncbi:hypothetical protein OF83DRAFT_1180906 [Amylostereum chailletii]|nr:hypothetical protein OF83DRAFT_1180906 [Amylostereum chailletii]
MSSTYRNSTFLGTDEVLDLADQNYENASQMPSWRLLTETALFGAFSLFVFLSLYVLMRKKSCRVPNRLMLLAVVVLYAGAALSWVTDILSTAESTTYVNTVAKYVFICMDAYSGGELCERQTGANNELAKILAGTAATGIPWQGCASTAVLAINMSISDFIVLWRAWVLWKHQEKWDPTSGSANLHRTTPLQL